MYKLIYNYKETENNKVLAEKEYFFGDTFRLKRYAVVEEYKPEPLEIVIPEPNNMGTVTIITQNPNTGEEVTTEVYGQIKILNNGKNGEQQQYILYTE